MGLIKFILVLLWCAPIAVLVLVLYLNLKSTIEKQKKASENIRKRKARFQGGDRYYRRQSNIHNKYNFRSTK